MGEIVGLILKWAVPFLCASVAGVCIAYVKGLAKRNRALEDGMQCLLRSEIIRSHKEYTEKGYCPIYAKESLERGYKAYKALGGNDVAHALYNEIVSLPSAAQVAKTDKTEKAGVK